MGSCASTPSNEEQSLPPSQQPHVIQVKRKATPPFKHHVSDSDSGSSLHQQETEKGSLPRSVDDSSGSGSSGSSGDRSGGSSGNSGTHPSKTLTQHASSASPRPPPSPVHRAMGGSAGRGNGSAARRHAPAPSNSSADDGEYCSTSRRNSNNGNTIAVPSFPPKRDRAMSLDVPPSSRGRLHGRMASNTTSSNTMTDATASVTVLSMCMAPALSPDGAGSDARSSPRSSRSQSPAPRHPGYSSYQASPPPARHNNQPHHHHHHHPDPSASASPPASCSPPCSCTSPDCVLCCGSPNKSPLSRSTVGFHRPPSFSPPALAHQSSYSQRGSRQMSATFAAPVPLNASIHNPSVPTATGTVTSRPHALSAHPSNSSSSASSSSTLTSAGSSQQTQHLAHYLSSRAGSISMSRSALSTSDVNLAHNGANGGLSSWTGRRPAATSVPGSSRIGSANASRTLTISSASAQAMNHIPSHGVPASAGPPVSRHQLREHAALVRSNSGSSHGRSGMLPTSPLTGLSPRQMDSMMIGVGSARNRSHSPSPSLQPASPLLTSSPRDGSTAPHRSSRLRPSQQHQNTPALVAASSSPTLSPCTSPLVLPQRTATTSSLAGTFTLSDRGGLGRENGEVDEQGVDCYSSATTQRLGTMRARGQSLADVFDACATTTNSTCQSAPASSRLGKRQHSTTAHAGPVIITPVDENGNPDSDNACTFNLPRDTLSMVETTLPSVMDSISPAASRSPGLSRMCSIELPPSFVSSTNVMSGRGSSRSRHGGMTYSRTVPADMSRLLTSMGGVGGALTGPQSGSQTPSTMRTPTVCTSHIETGYTFDGYGHINQYIVQLDERKREEIITKHNGGDMAARKARELQTATGAGTGAGVSGRTSTEVSRNPTDDDRTDDDDDDDVEEEDDDQLDDADLDESTILGRGSYGVVKKVFDTQTNDFKAMKVMSKSLLARGRGDGLTSARREIAIMRKLSHENIVKLYEVLCDENRDEIYLIQEFAEGGPIMSVDIMDEDCEVELPDGSVNILAEPLPLDVARDYFRDVLKGLEYLHHQHVIHRDIKPENLLTDATGRVMIADFGVSTLVDGEDGCNDVASVAAGTGVFMSPETVKGGARKRRGEKNDESCACTCTDPDAEVACSNPLCGAATDIWSLGVTLYFMVYGRLPFYSRSLPDIYKDICEKDVTFPHSPEFAHIPETVRDLIRAMLRKSPHERATIEEIYQNPWVNADGTWQPHAETHAPTDMDAYAYAYEHGMDEDGASVPAAGSYCTMTCTNTCPLAYKSQPLVAHTLQESDVAQAMRGAEVHKQHAVTATLPNHSYQQKRLGASKHSHSARVGSPAPLPSVPSATSSSMPIPVPSLPLTLTHPDSWPQLIHKIKRRIAIWRRGMKQKCDTRKAERARKRATLGRHTQTQTTTCTAQSDLKTIQAALRDKPAQAAIAVQ